MASTALAVPQAATQPELPANPYDIQDPKAKEYLDDRISTRFRAARYNRWKLEKDWIYLAMMAAGNHWIAFDRYKRQWRARKGPDWFPRPVTNRVEEQVKANVSALLQKAPNPTWYPETHEYRDVQSAMMANRANRYLEICTGRRRMSHQLARWVVNCGDGFLESYYDPGTGGTEFIEAERCMDCFMVSDPMQIVGAKNACPGCGGTNLEPAREIEHCTCPHTGQQVPGDELAGQPSPFAMDAPDGPPMMEPTFGQGKLGRNYPKGNFGQKVRSPFEVFYNPAINDFTYEGGLHWCVIFEMIDKDEAIDLWGKEAVEEHSQKGASAARGDSLSLLYRDMLYTATPDHFQNSTGGDFNSSAEIQFGDRVILETYYQYPDKHCYTEGVMSRRLGGHHGNTVELGPLKFHDPEEKPYVPVVQFPFHRQAGRVAGRTVIMDIAKINEKRNWTDAWMQSIERRMGNPVWMAPKGSLVEDPTGDAGAIVEYHPERGMTGSGRVNKPERLAGENPPAYYQWRLEKYDQEIAELGGGFGVSQGQPPPGVVAGNAIAYLGEKQRQSMAPQVEQWELAWEQVLRQQMWMFRQFGVAARIHPVPHSENQWTFEQFSKADLQGRFNVRIEAGSALPVSNLQQRATIEGLVGLQLMPVDNPSTLYKIHQIFGTEHLLGPIHEDMHAAQRENEEFMKLVRGEEGGHPYVIRPSIDNHPIHIAEMVGLAKTDQFIALERKAQAGDILSQYLVFHFHQHLEQHQSVDVMQQMAAAQQAQLAAGDQSPSGGPSSGSPGRPEGSGEKKFGDSPQGQQSKQKRETAKSKKTGGGIEERSRPITINGGESRPMA